MKVLLFVISIVEIVLIILVMSGLNEKFKLLQEKMNQCGQVLKEIYDLDDRLKDKYAKLIEQFNKMNLGIRDINDILKGIQEATVNKDEEVEEAVYGSVKEVIEAIVENADEETVESIEIVNNEKDSDTGSDINLEVVTYDSKGRARDSKGRFVKKG